MLLGPGDVVSRLSRLHAHPLHVLNAHSADRRTLTVQELRTATNALRLPLATVELEGFCRAFGADPVHSPASRATAAQGGTPSLELRLDLAKLPSTLVGGGSSAPRPPLLSPPRGGARGPLTPFEQRLRSPSTPGHNRLPHLADNFEADGHAMCPTFVAAAVPRPPTSRPLLTTSVSLAQSAAGEETILRNEAYRPSMWARAMDAAEAKRGGGGEGSTGDVFGAAAASNAGADAYSAARSTPDIRPGASHWREEGGGARVRFDGDAETSGSALRAGSPQRRTESSPLRPSRGAPEAAASVYFAGEGPKEDDPLALASIFGDDRVDSPGIVSPTSARRVQTLGSSQPGSSVAAAAAAAAPPSSVAFSLSLLNLHPAMAGAPLTYAAPGPAGYADMARSYRRGHGNANIGGVDHRPLPANGRRDLLATAAAAAAAAAPSTLDSEVRSPHDVKHHAPATAPPHISDDAAYATQQLRGAVRRAMRGSNSRSAALGLRHLLAQKDADRDGIVRQSDLMARLQTLTPELSFGTLALAVSSISGDGREVGGPGASLSSHSTVVPLSPRGLAVGGPFSTDRTVVIDDAVRWLLADDAVLPPAFGMGTSSAVAGFAATTDRMRGSAAAAAAPQSDRSAWLAQPGSFSTFRTNWIARHGQAATKELASHVRERLEPGTVAAGETPLPFRVLRLSVGAPSPPSKASGLRR